MDPTSVALSEKGRNRASKFSRTFHGGVSGFRYLTTFGELSAAGAEALDPALPKVAKFIAIGAPFNEFIDTSSRQTITDLVTNGPTEASPRYQEFQGLLKQGASTPD